MPAEGISKLNGNTDLWACPHCLSGLATDADSINCIGCDRRYLVTANGQQDFRLTEKCPITLEYVYDPVWARFPWDLVQVDWPRNPFPFIPPSNWEETESHIARSIPT